MYDVSTLACGRSSLMAFAAFPAVFISRQAMMTCAPWNASDRAVSNPVSNNNQVTSTDSEIKPAANAKIILLQSSVLFTTCYKPIF